MVSTLFVKEIQTSEKHCPHMKDVGLTLGEDQEDMAMILW